MSSIPFNSKMDALIAATTATLWVDAVNGNDSSGQRNRLDRPFATPWGAGASAQAGDLILIGPGTWDMTSYGTWTLPVACKIKGAGSGVTVINYNPNPHGGAAIAIAPIAGCSFEDLDLATNTPEIHGYVYVVSTPTPQDNVTFSRIGFTGVSDIIYPGANGSPSSTVFTWSFYDCKFNTNYDNLNSQNLTGGVLKYYHCDFSVTWDGVSHLPMRGVACGAGSAYLYDCNIVVNSPDSTSGAIGVLPYGGGSIYMYGGSINVTGTGTGGFAPYQADITTANSYFYYSSVALDPAQFKPGSHSAQYVNLSPAIAKTLSADPTSTPTVGATGQFGYFGTNFYMNVGGGNSGTNWMKGTLS